MRKTVLRIDYTRLDREVGRKTIGMRIDKKEGKEYMYKNTIIKVSSCSLITTEKREMQAW